jgi:predicted PurR-regulated permease PerM
MIFLGVVSMIGLWLLNVPLAFALGLFTGVMIFIPYIGALLSEIPAALVALVQGPGKMIEVIILYLVVHVLEGYIITPYAQRKAVRLPPAATILAQLFMLKMAGLLGVVVATPLAAAILALVEKLYLEKHSQTSAPAVARQVAGR